MTSLLRRTTYLLLALAGPAQAADTVCNNNGGAGWPIFDFGITNISVPFSFGDVSALHDIDVSTDITHTFVGDLTAKITSPDSGTQIILFERPGTTSPEFSSPGGFGCNRDDIDATFDDESANARIEDQSCDNVTPVFSGDYQPHNAAPGNLGAFDGDNPNGDWGIYISDSANQDTGTLNEVCLTIAYSAVTFDKWVSTNATCSDTLDSIAVAPGTDVYYCYTVSNPSTETFSIGAADWSDSLGHDLSGLQRTYAQGESQTIVDGPYVAGTDLNGTVVNSSSVTANFATVNFTGTLVSDETATVVISDPIINTSTKSVLDVDGGSPEPGDLVRYTITINETAGIYTPDVDVSDLVESNLENVTVTSIPPGAVDSSSGNNINISGIELPAGGSATIVFEASIVAGTPADTVIGNVAIITHADSGVTYNAVAPNLIVSAPNLTTSSKSVLDVNGNSALPGDLLRYTITINETGGHAAANVQVIDIVDASLNSINVISIPPGATDSSIGNTIDINTFSIPANGSATIVFEANISGAISTGASINNTAAITDLETGVSVSRSSPTVVIGSLPTSGVKRLYFDTVDTAADLTRVSPLVDSTLTFAYGTTVTASQGVPFAAPFKITGGSTTNVQLQLRRRGGGGDRTVRVDLYNGNTGTLIGTNSSSWSLNGWVSINLPISIPSDVNFAPGDFIRAVVTNSGPINRDFELRTVNGALRSEIQMQSDTVINVDTIGVYNAAYPGITQFLSNAPGSTVYIRATVSDPFGNADITSATVTIEDSTAAVVVNGDAMTTVDTPTPATRVLEYPYTIPPNPDGFWKINIIANEGTEGTVAHTALTTMIVGLPIITVSKDSLVLSDPVNTTNPKAIPNAIVEYTVNVTNSGFGYTDANTIAITDPLPPQTTFFFGSPVSPVQFTDGSASSGLSYTFSGLGSTTDDVAFSNDGGSTFITPSVDGSGFDTTSPPINFIRINPKGGFRGSNGVANPSFELRYRVRVE